MTNRGDYGGWDNATYDDYLDQAARSQVQDTRKALFKQAEEILVETDAVTLIPAVLTTLIFRHQALPGTDLY